MFNKFHSYNQAYSADCGQTCIRMIARHYGLDIDYKYLCSMADSDRQGLSVTEMTNLLGKLQFDSIALNLDIR